MTGKRCIHRPAELKLLALRCDPTNAWLLIATGGSVDRFELDLPGSYCLSAGIIRHGGLLKVGCNEGIVPPFGQLDNRAVDDVWQLSELLLKRPQLPYDWLQDCRIV